MLKISLAMARMILPILLLSALAFGEDRYLVRVKGDVREVATRNRMNIVRPVTDPAKGVYLLSPAQSASARVVLNGLSTDAAVIGAEVDQMMVLPGIKAGAPASTAAAQASALQLDGTPTPYWGATVAAAYVNQQAAQIVNLSKAQRLATGRNVRVAIIDTGIDTSHPVLARYVGPGYDFVHNTCCGQELVDLNQETTPILDQETTPILDQETTPILDGGSAIILKQETTPILDQETTPILDSKLYPAFGHGTMVAGLVHLVAPQALLMPVRVFAANGTATVSQVIAGIYWAVDHGADVINMSFSTPQASPQLSEALEYASRNGVICVASAGNDGMATQVFPAAYGAVIGVGSTNNSMVRSLFSNYGTPLVSLAAPGESVLTVYPRNHYAQVSGTSFSAPLVAGGAALLVDMAVQIDGTEASAALSHATYIGQELGAGELDLYQACLAVIKKN